MGSQDFKLIIITSEKNISGEIDTIIKLFESGLHILHLRKPDMGIYEMKQLLTIIPTPFHHRIVIHSHYELLYDFNLKGAHLPEKIRMGGNSGDMKNIISTSFHRLEDMVETKFSFEYVFYGPVFQSISKQGYKPSQKLKTIKDFFKTNKNQIRFPVIALGGITDENISEIEDLRFNGAACIGYIWENSDPVAQLKNLQKII